MIDSDKLFQWVAGILGTLVTALVIWIASFLYNFDKNVESIAMEVHARGGVERTEIEQINGILASMDAKLSAADADRADIKQDIRTIVDILSRP